MTVKFPTISDDAVAELRARIGQPVQRVTLPTFTEVNADASRLFANAIGDNNPLWTDADYAASTRWKTLLAPPCILYSTDNVVSGAVEGLPSVHAMYSGTNWHWFEPVRVGTKMTTRSTLTGMVEHETRFAGRAFQQIYMTEFFDQTGTKLAEAESWCFRTERDTAREAGTKYDKAKQRAPMHYTPEDIERIFALYGAETIRGAEPRYLEDVQVGEELPTMAKGPMTVTGFIAFAQGWGGLYIRANKLAYQQLRKHPGLGIENAFGIPDVPERVHWENDLATDVGTPGAYDYGPERCSWLIHHLTNWMGDDGFLRHHHCEIRHHNVVGDWLTITGKVTAIGPDDEGVPSVTVEQEARNQHGDLSARGTGTIRLPRR
jgi:acyl dehydratase